MTLKKYQQAFGYLYQSVLRAEVTARYGVVFDPIVNGQAEIAGVPTELLDQFSKRAREIDTEMGDKLADFLHREGRDPSGFEYAAMEREAAVDTRSKKTGLGVPDLRTRWQREAASLGIDAADVDRGGHRGRRAASAGGVAGAGAGVGGGGGVGVAAVDVESDGRAAHDLRHRVPTTRTRRDQLGDRTRRVGEHGAGVLYRSRPGRRLDATRASDGRSVWIEPITNQSTSEHILTQEEHILTWALDAQANNPTPSATITDVDVG